MEQILQHIQKDCLERIQDPGHKSGEKSCFVGILPPEVAEGLQSCTSLSNAEVSFGTQKYIDSKSCGNAGQTYTQGFRATRRNHIIFPADHPANENEMDGQYERLSSPQKKAASYLSMKNRKKVKRDITERVEKSKQNKREKMPNQS